MIVLDMCHHQCGGFRFIRIIMGLTDLIFRASKYCFSYFRDRRLNSRNHNCLQIKLRLEAKIRRYNKYDIGFTHRLHELLRPSYAGLSTVQKLTVL